MISKSIQIDSYDYPLPEDRIAQHPLAVRDACKLLVHEPEKGNSDHIFKDLPELLPDNTLLVYNNTRVINARLRFRKQTGAQIEIFCLEPETPADYAECFASTEACDWKCFVGNSKKWKDGELESIITLPEGETSTLFAERVRGEGNAWIIAFRWTGGYSFAEIIAAAGEIPIPPYLNRKTEDADSRDYQTVYSHINGSVAAPTAGLHFTPELLERVSDKGIERLEVTLHVGAGTFQPVKSDCIGDHPMHSEFIAVEASTIRRLAQEADKKQVIAVGTTSVRTLESLYHIGCLIYQNRWDGEVPQWYPYEDNHPNLSASEALSLIADRLEKNGESALIASTRIIIAPGYQYRVVKGMVTNFHQPRSTLLLLVSAFIGEDKWMPMYEHALAGNYRFLSYGDACLLLK